MPPVPLEPEVDNPFNGQAPTRRQSLRYLEWQGVTLSQAQMRRMRAQLQSPMLVIAATEHASPPAIEALWLETQKALAASSPHGRLLVATGSGHDVFRDAPELVASEMKRFLDEAGLR